jgi:lipopolysaccharide export LptBFGC system permease protein LptF
MPNSEYSQNYSFHDVDPDYDPNYTTSRREEPQLETHYSSRVYQPESTETNRVRTHLNFKDVPKEYWDSDALKIILENHDQKADSQRKMAWVALASVIILMALLVSPLIAITRIEALVGLISTFVVARISLVGFFFGAQAYITRTNSR